MTGRARRWRQERQPPVSWSARLDGQGPSGRLAAPDGLGRSVYRERPVAADGDPVGCGSETGREGLGIMGLAELFAPSASCDSDTAVRLAGGLGRHIRHHARQASADLAETPGRFPLFLSTPTPGGG